MEISRRLREATSRKLASLTREQRLALLNAHLRPRSRRIDELARKSTEGELTADDREEYAGYVRANKFIAVLRRTSGISAP